MGALTYHLDSRMPWPALLLATLQWLAFTVANVVTVPVVLGHAFSLTSAQTAVLMDQTFVAVGVIGLVQSLIGHRYPIVEGPAGMWWGVFLILAQMTRDVGGSFASLLQELELGLIVGGAVTAGLALCGLLSAVRRLFTPAVTGTFLILLSLQISRSLVPGILGVGYQGARGVFPEVALLSILIIAFTTLLMVKGRGWLQSLSVLIGLAAGWMAFALLRLTHSPGLSAAGWWVWPHLFPWGPPRFHLGVVLTCAITSLILLSNLIASIQAMGQALGETPGGERFARGTLWTGAGTAVCGCLGSAGLIPLATAASLVALTSVGARLPFVFGSVLVVVLGLVPKFGMFAASLPSPVGYAVLFTVFGQLLGLGLRDLKRLAMDQRDLLVVSLSLLSGVGIFFVSARAWSGTPPVLGYLLDNGLIVGVGMVLLLEHLVFRRRMGHDSEQPDRADQGDGARNPDGATGHGDPAL
ncbi:MAG: purine/pyrimidine permease [Alicyclobacillus sp.]|nr:purine/pyrimidine permease [Alicyclobacillus sp.]